MGREETKIAVFLGPSCTEAEARKYLPDATYLTPAARGAIYQIINDGYDTIVLIDGLFYASFAVWHKEIMFALSAGISVIGASSMGALRAAELHTTGMIGIGTIFEWYRDGVIDGDDEVALLHQGHGEDYAAVTLPLVNLRQQLHMAVGQGVITQAQEQLVIASAKALCFTDRSLLRILDPLQDQIDVPGLTHWLEQNSEDLKQQDAIKALTFARQLQSTGTPSASASQTNFELVHINIGIEYYSAERTNSIPAKSDAGEISLARVQIEAGEETTQFPDYLKARAYERLIAGWARELRLEPAEGFTATVTPWNPDVIDAAHRKATGLTLIDIARERRDHALCRAMERKFCGEAAPDLLEQLDRVLECAPDGLDWRVLADLNGGLVYTLWRLGVTKGLAQGMIGAGGDALAASVENIMLFATEIGRLAPQHFGYAFAPAREILVLRQYFNRLCVLEPA